MAEKRSPAVYIGIGCAAVILVMIVLGGACALWVYNQGQRIEAEMRDPDQRRNRVLQVLNADAIPDGYYPMVALSVPFLMDIAILSDREPDAEGKVDGFDERDLIYVKMIRMGQDKDELRDYFEGRTDDPAVLRDNGIRVDVDELIGRGAFTSGDARLMYVAQRGNVSVQGRRGEGITSVVWIECEQDSRMRIAIWFGPDPDPEATAEELDVTGTPADEAALREFLGGFHFCG